MAQTFFDQFADGHAMDTLMGLLPELTLGRAGAGARLAANNSPPPVLGQDPADVVGDRYPTPPTQSPPMGGDIFQGRPQLRQMQSPDSMPPPAFAMPVGEDFAQGQPESTPLPTADPRPMAMNATRLDTSLKGDRAGPFNGPAAGPFNVGPGDPFQVAPKMWGPGAPNMASGYPGANGPLPPPPDAAALPAAAAPVMTPPLAGVPLTPPAPRAPPELPPEPPSTGSRLGTALGGMFGSRQGRAALGAGLTAGAGPGRLGAFMKGMGGGLSAGGAQGNIEKREEMDTDKFEEGKAHTRFQEQNTVYDRLVKQPYDLAHRKAQTEWLNARTAAAKDGTGKGSNAWQMTPFGRVVIADREIEKQIESEKKSIRQGVTAGTKTAQQAKDEEAALEQKRQTLRTEYYKRYGISPQQADLERTRGQSAQNPLDPVGMGLTKEQFDVMVPKDAWFIPKAGAAPVQRTKAPLTDDEKRTKAETDKVADEMAAAE